ncbi:ATP-binding protein [Streptomyces rimosus]|uniref:ATP-binding protein n=1 Tax=Streptomyces rimosus TaxID=1927 RepID=UPI0004C795B7|nr:ATP-binding protein [Streptomyces rimosus]
MSVIAPRSHAIGVPGYSETLPCTPESVHRARQLVDTALRTWGLSGLTDDVTVAASELVTNAVQHAKGRHFRLRISRLAPSRVLIAVTDRSFVQPVLRTPNADDARGRGLVLVDELAAHWGTEPRPFGKTVWAEFVNARQA